jgi:hypothetical protein
MADTKEQDKPTEQKAAAKKWPDYKPDANARYAVTEATDPELKGVSFDTLPGENGEIALPDGTRFPVLYVRPVDAKHWSVANTSASMVWRDRSVK